MNKNIIPRFLSLDVFRGMTIILMVIVNSPGNAKPYGWLTHAAWDGCKLADVVFPFFIIIVGISAVLALSNFRLKGFSEGRILKKVLFRTGDIFLVGLLLNAFPHHLTDFSSLRVMGVLQRIAICYGVSALLFLKTSMRTQALIALAALILYGLFIGVFSSDMVGQLDRLIFSSSHLYTKTFDPEGLVSTLPAIASVLLGNLIGFLLISNQPPLRKIGWMSLAGILLLLFGFGLDFILPINKSLWSSSYVLWTAGLFLLSYTLVYVLIEIKHWERWSKFFNLFGRHALLVYVLHVLFLKIQLMIQLQNAAGKMVSLRVYLSENLFGYLSIENASLAYSVSYVMLWFLVLLSYEKLKPHV